MELTFLGKGSAYNTQLGNNSAYIKAGSSLFLLDCGGTVFSKLMEKDVDGHFLLEGVTSVTIAVTHLHDDHIGSLQTLIYYCYYKLGILPKLVYPNPVDLCDMLYKMGVRRNFYYMDELKINNCHGYKTNDMDFYLEPVEVQHFMGMFSYAYFIDRNDKTIYYSGDAKEIPKDAIDMLTNGKIDEFYQDISGRPVNSNEYWPHLQYEDALNILPLEVRSKVYIMHQDEELVAMAQTAIDDGFQVV